MVPRALLLRPQLQKRDLPYWEAFFVFNATRSGSSNGPNPIPLTEYLAYFEMVGIASVGLRSKYVRLMQKLDGIYLQHCREKTAAAAKQT